MHAESVAAPGRRRRAALWLALALAALAALAHGARLALPVPIAEPGVARVQCVSYAPFRRPGESPFDPQAFVDPDRIETDLRLLAAITGCVRTYSVSQGLDAVPAVARRLGMTVLLGAWLGRDRAANETELDRVIEVAGAHSDTVTAVVVGNEVLLRRELPEAELVAHIARVRGAVPVPVTYADVWEFWLEHPSIAPAVSFATVHILPYWEDEPVGIDGAVDHVVAVWRRMRGELAGREILVGETGWPSEGRARRDAVPGRVEQARFVRGFTAAAAGLGIRYNLIEGFDQPWKRRLEGAMGGAWGLLDSDGRAKFDLHGAVAAREGGRAWAWSAAAGSALGAVALALARRGRGRGVATHAAVGALAGAGLGAMFVEQARHLVVWNRDWLEWTATGAATATVWAACAASAVLLARRLAGAPVAGAPVATVPVASAPFDGNRTGDPASRGGGALPAAAVVLRDWLRSGRDPTLAGWVALLHAMVLFAAAVTVVLHGVDARYRGFAWPLFAPAAVAAALLWGAGFARGAAAIEERLLGWVLVAGAAVMVAKEGPGNGQALGYAALMGVLAGAALARARTSAASNAPTAAGSTL